MVKTYLHENWKMRRILNGRKSDVMEIRLPFVRQLMRRALKF